MLLSIWPSLVLMLFIFIILLVWGIVRNERNHAYCPLCDDNISCKKNQEGRKICTLHGDVTDFDAIGPQNEDDLDY
jgi:hypothetical protein